VQRNEHRQRQEEAKLLRKIAIKEELRRVEMSVEYLVARYKVVVAFIIIFKMCRREGI
jgi:hypothetical protein